MALTERMVQQGRTRNQTPFNNPTERIAVTAIMALLVVVMTLLARATFDPIERAERAAAAARAAAQSGQLVGWELAAGAIWRIAPAVAAAVLLIGGALLALWVIYARWGAPIVARGQLQITELRAAHQPTATTRPQLAPAAPAPSAPAAQLPPAPAVPVAPSVPDLAAVAAADLEDEPPPTFGELLDAGEIGRTVPLVLGIDAQGEVIPGSWRDLYSTAVAGLPGTGKTTTQRYLAAQAALHGARFVIVDPQAGAGEETLADTLAPLAHTYLCEPASSPRAILDAVRLVADIGQRRTRGQDAERGTVLLWLDEATALLGHSTIGPELAALLEQIAQQYRKVGVFASLAGQIWTGNRSGGTALRDSLASVLCHRMRRSQARLLLPTDDARRAERLAQGRAILWRTTGESQVIAIPNTTAADLVRVGQLLAPPAKPTARPGSPYPNTTDIITQLLTMPVAPTAKKAEDVPPVDFRVDFPQAPAAVPVEVNGKSNGSLLEVKTELASSASESRGSQLTLDAETARIVELFRGGLDVASIVAEVYQVEAGKGGRRYQERAMHVQAAIRSAL